MKTQVGLPCNEVHTPIVICYSCGLTLNKSSKFLVLQPLQVRTQALAHVHQSATVNYKPRMQKLPMCGCKVFPLNVLLLRTETDDVCNDEECQMYSIM